MRNGNDKIVCEGEKDKITEFIDYIKQNTPSFAAIEDITMEYESYRGEFTTFERRGTDVPREEGEILTVLKSFDAKAEKMVVILSAMSEKLGRIDERQDKTVEILRDVKKDTSATLGKQDKMLEKQDRTIGILEDVREDTGEITNALTFLNLKEIHRETVELREKYELLSRDVEAIKMKIKIKFWIDNREGI